MSPAVSSGDGTFTTTLWPSVVSSARTMRDIPLRFAAFGANVSRTFSRVRPFVPQERSSYEVHLDADPGRDRSRETEPQAERVFRLAICGAFSGHRAAPNASDDAARAWRVDRDDFDDVLAAVAPRLQLELGKGMVVDVQIRELDDFHPDQLFERVPQFARLRELRAELADPRTFSRAAAALSSPTPTPRRPAAMSQGSLLDEIVGGDAPAEQAANADSLYDFIQRAMAPHLVARADPRQAELLAQADSAIASAMRALLHHPSFQSLEALWRGVFRLVRQVDTDERLQVHLIDVSRQALRNDMLQAQDVRKSALYRTLQSRAPSDQGGWGVLVAHYALGGDENDIAVLEQLALLGVALDAPWLAEAHQDLAMGGLSEAAMESWQHLRESNAASHLGLAMPRVLLRLPYGSDTDATERFKFEELEGDASHASYLWGNPALFCATLLALGFTESGAGFSAGGSSQIDGLPLHLTKRGGETIVKPCAEVVMREADALALLEAGFIPMCGLRDQDVVRVPRVQSVASPAARLSGRLSH